MGHTLTFGDSELHIQGFSTRLWAKDWVYLRNMPRLKGVAAPQAVAEVSKSETAL